MSNLASKASSSPLGFSPVGSEDDDIALESDGRPISPDRPLLRLLTRCALGGISAAFILGTLVASERDPVFSPHVLAPGSLEADGSQGAAGLHFLVSLFSAALTMLAGAAAVLTDRRRWVRRLSLLTMVLVLFQMGSRLLASSQLQAVWLSLVHPLSAQFLLVSLGMLSYAHSRELLSRLNSLVSATPSPLFPPAVFVFGLVALQLISGAFLRITDAGLAVPDFPTTGGGFLPLPTEAVVSQINQLRADLGLAPATLGQVLLHLTHRLGSVVLLFAGVLLGAKVLQSREFAASKARTSAILLLAGLLCETLIGAFLIWSLLDPIALSLHLCVSVMVLYSSAMLACRLRFQV